MKDKRHAELARLINKMWREHDLTLSAYGRWARMAIPDSKTGKKHYADYERHADEFDAARDAAINLTHELGGLVPIIPTKGSN